MLSYQATISIDRLIHRWSGTKGVFKDMGRTWSSSVISINAGTLILGDFVRPDDEIHAPTTVRPERKRKGNSAGEILDVPGQAVKATVT